MSNLPAINPEEIYNNSIELITDGQVDLKEWLPVLESLSRDVTIIKHIITVAKLKGQITDLLFLKKLRAFLFEGKFDQKALDDLHRKLSDDKYQKLWEKVFQSLNSHDDEERSVITAKLLLAFIDGYLEESELHRLFHAANTIDLYLLPLLKELYSLGDERPMTDSSINYAMASLGLLNVDASMIGAVGVSGGPVYPLNPLGWKFVGIVNDFEESAIKDIRLGVGELVTSLSEGGTSTGNAYPLSVLHTKNLPYNIAELIAVNSKNEILCNVDRPVPNIIYAKELGIGKSNDSIANEFVTAKGINTYDDPVALIARKSVSPARTRNAVMIPTDDVLPDTMPVNPHEIKLYITNHRGEIEDYSYFEDFTDWIINNKLNKPTNNRDYPATTVDEENPPV